jgi:hypothetical protein
MKRAGAACGVLGCGKKGCYVAYTEISLKVMWNDSEGISSNGYHRKRGLDDE